MGNNTLQDGTLLIWLQLQPQAVLWTEKSKTVCKMEVTSREDYSFCVISSMV